MTTPSKPVASSGEQGLLFRLFQSPIAILLIYTLTMFTSATLLFMVQPMFARVLLPHLGGSPAVWNTTVVFYQVILLGGYIYAHFIATRLPVRWQGGLQIALLLFALIALPLGIPEGWVPPTTGNPIPWLLALLTVAVALPFFVISITSPLLQSWFVRTKHPSAHNPYFLYAASNAGSMLALISYPFLIEPQMRLSQQTQMWTIGYGFFIVCMLCAVTCLWLSAKPATQAEEIQAEVSPSLPAIAWKRRWYWAFVAAVPSSLMLSVTSYLSANIVPLPMLWVIPLALYLLTFILVFANKQILPHSVMRRALPIVLLPLMIVICAQATQPLWMLVGLHLLAFFIITMVCHGELAADRPAPQQLTEFYLWLSIGGAIGGLFNALIAPFIFNTLAEYQWVLVLGYALLPALSSIKQSRQAITLDFALPAALGLLTLAMMWLSQMLNLPSGPASYGLIFGIPALLCFSFSRRPWRFALGMGAIFLASTLYISDQGRVLYAERSFYGMHRVLQTGEFNAIAHGGTLHGKQSRDPARAREPLSYYTKTGPMGQVFDQFDPQRVALVGLGAGALACYADAGEDWVIYELDPTVEYIAKNTEYFSYLSECLPNAPIILGDARLTLSQAEGEQYDLIVLDAYSSDSTPTHLLTREALAMYREHLNEGGILAFHISNQYLDFTNILAILAKDAGMVSLYQDDRQITREELAAGKSASQWMILAERAEDIAAFSADPRWVEIPVAENALVWTDDFSSVLHVFKLP